MSPPIRAIGPRSISWRCTPTAPAGTPKAIVDRLNKELNAALADPDVQKRLANEGADALPGTPQAYADDIDKEETKWGALVRKLGLKLE